MPLGKRIRLVYASGWVWLERMEPEKSATDFRSLGSPKGNLRQGIGTDFNL